MSKTPFFSIIMACTLSDYKGAATDRERKLIRAIESVIAQSYGSWELIIVADGCQRTFDLVSDKYGHDERIDCLLMPGQIGTTWNNVNICRNAGKKAAFGIYIVYLDSDDIFGTEHLHKIKAGIDYLFTTDLPAAVFFNDRRAMVENDVVGSIEQNCALHRGKCGTSNIAFQRQIPVSWEDRTYLHDWVFIKSLMRHCQIKTIQPAEYVVCHIPFPKKMLDV